MGANHATPYFEKVNRDTHDMCALYHATPYFKKVNRDTHEHVCFVSLEKKSADLQLPPEYNVHKTYYNTIWYSTPIQVRLICAVEGWVHH